MNPNQAKSLGSNAMVGAFMVLLVPIATHFGLAPTPEQTDAAQVLIGSLAAYFFHRETVVTK